MDLSLSVRIAEGFLSKEEAILSLEEVADIAEEAGFDAICMRASQVGIQSPDAQVDQAYQLLRERNLSVSMLTGNFDVVYNNEQGPNCLRDISPFLKLAKQLRTRLIRVALKTDDDIPWAQRAADQAAEHGIQLAHQCHTLSLFETVDGIIETLESIDRPNFRLIFEPANLEICGQDYGPDTIERLTPWIENVYLQNQVIRPPSPATEDTAVTSNTVTANTVTLDTWCRGPVTFDLIEIHEPGGIDFASVFEGLKGIGYEKTVTVHQSAPQGIAPRESATATADFLRQFID